MRGSKRRIFSGKHRLHEEPFCPVVSDDTGYHSLFRNRNATFANPAGLGNTGSFGAVGGPTSRRDDKRTSRW